LALVGGIFFLIPRLYYEELYSETNKYALQPDVVLDWKLACGRQVQRIQELGLQIPVAVQNFYTS